MHNKICILREFLRVNFLSISRARLNQMGIIISWNYSPYLLKYIVEFGEIKCYENIQYIITHHRESFQLFGKLQTVSYQSVA